MREREERERERWKKEGREGRHYLLFYELPQNAVIPSAFDLLLFAVFFHSNSIRTDIQVACFVAIKKVKWVFDFYEQKSLSFINGSSQINQKNQ